MKPNNLSCKKKNQMKTNGKHETIIYQPIKEATEYRSNFFSIKQKRIERRQGIKTMRRSISLYS